jgi:hopene-associated glycosyltransferase HpnB
VSALAAIPLLIWCYLAIGHGRFWRTDIRLPPGPAPEQWPGIPEQWPSVTVVIPARDEADVLPLTLPTLLAQDYPGTARVILVDDNSSDGTAELARRLQPTPRLALQVLPGAERPCGWAGKLWALHQGADAANSEFLLFSDADIAHEPDSLRRLVAWAGARRLDSASLMARLPVANGWERMIVPAFVYLFAELYPFQRVNTPQARTAAAAGGCLLVRRAALARAGGIAAVRGAVIDDVALARALKRSGAAIWLGLADGVTSVRPYPHLGDLWDMVARSAFTQLRHSTALLAGTLLGLAVVFLGPPATLAGGLATGNAAVALLGGAAWAVMTATYVPMLRYYGLNPLRALSLGPVAALFGGMTVSSALRHWRGGVTWKGRRYGRTAALVKNRGGPNGPTIGGA